MNAEKRAKVLMVACAVLPGLLLSSHSLGQQVFVDNFNNGSVANSDTHPGFWTTVLDETGSATEPVGGPINLTASGASAADPYPFTEIGTSATQSSFNFFDQPIVLSVSGLNYSAATTTNALTEFNFGSQVISQTGIQTEYNEPSDFSLEICPVGGANGQLIMGEKQNYPNHSSPWDSYQFVGPIGHVANGAQTFNGGSITGFDLVIASGFFYLNVYSNASATSNTQVTTNYFGRMALNWTPDAGSANGDPVLNIETQINEGTPPQVPTDVSSLSISKLSVSQMPMNWTNNGGDNNWFTPSNWSGLSSAINPATAVADGIAVPDYGAANVILPQVSSPTAISLANGNGDTVTVGVLNINSTNSYTITGSALQLATGNGTDQINVTAGSHMINVGDGTGGNPGLATYDPTLKINLAGGSSLTINGAVGTGTGVTIPMTIDTTGGAGALTINGDVASAGAITLNVGSGGMTINGGPKNDFLFHGPLTLNVASGGTLAINSYIDDPFAGGNPPGLYPLSKTGPGLAVVSSLYQIPSVTVSGGTLKIAASTTANNFLQGGSLIYALTLSGGGKLDLANNDLVINYTSNSTLTNTIRGYLQSGAIFSSTASLHLGTTVGYAEASEINQTSAFYGLPTDSSSSCLMYTYEGDVNMDGIVNSADFSLMTSGNGSDWYNGDLNYDGVKNADDWALFQLGVAASARGNINTLPAPEPGSLAILGAAGIGFIRRRAVSR